MLGFGRLFKYEFKSVGRVMLPIYGALIASSLIMGVFNSTPWEDGGILSVTTMILYGLMVMAVIAFTTVILIQRFYKNLLGNEGYLCFTLPVSTNAHIANKTLSAGVWMILGCIVGLLSVLIVAAFFDPYFKQELSGLFSSIHNVSGENLAKTILYVFEGLIIVALGCCETAIKVYAAISLGQQWSKHRMLGAVGAYIGFTIIESIVANVLETLSDGVFDRYSAMYYGMSEFAMSQVDVLVVFVAIAALIAIYWVINYRLLDKRLNLQ